MKKLNKSKYGIFINDQNIIFCYPPPPIKKLKISEKVDQLILMNVLNIIIDPFLLRKYNMFRQNTKSSLEQ